MARVRVEDSSVAELFRPGGTVDQITRRDNTGRTRFNLETGLGFADKAMKSPALGVLGNLIARGVGGAARAANTPSNPDDMQRLRMDAAAKLAEQQGQPQMLQTAPMAAAPMAPQQPMAAAPMAPQQPMAAAPMQDEQSMAAAPMQAEQPIAPPQAMAAPPPAAPVLSPQDKARAELQMAEQRVAYQRQNLLRGATSGDRFLQQQAHADLQMAEQDLAAAKQRANPTPAVPPSTGKYIDPEDLKRHTELVKAAGKATSRQEAEAIAREREKHQHDMVRKILTPTAPAAAPMEPTQPPAPPVIASEAAAPEAGQPEQAAPQVSTYQTPNGPIRSVKIGDGRMVIQDPETNDYLVVGRGGNGKMSILHRIPEEEANNMFSPQDLAGEPAGAQASDVEKQKTLIRDQMQAMVDPTTGAVDRRQGEGFDRLADQLDVLEGRPAGSSSVQLSSERAPNYAGMSREQLLAAAPMAKSVGQQRELLKAVGDLPVYGTTLQDLLTGSTEARGQFAKELHALLPGAKQGKTEEETDLARAQARHQNAMAGYYETQKGIEDENRRKAQQDTVAQRREAAKMRSDQKTNELIEKNRHSLATETTNELKRVDTVAKNKARESIDKLRVDLDLNKHAEKIREFNKMDAEGHFRYRPGMSINVINQRESALKDLGANAQKILDRIEKEEDDARKASRDNAWAAKLPPEDFAQRYTNGNPDPKPASGGSVLTEAVDAAKIKAWNDKDKRNKEEYAAAIKAAATGQAADAYIDNPERLKDKQDAKEHLGAVMGTSRQFLKETEKTAKKKGH